MMLELGSPEGFDDPRLGCRRLFADCLVGRTTEYLDPTTPSVVRDEVVVPSSVGDVAEACSASAVLEASSRLGDVGVRSAR